MLPVLSRLSVVVVVAGVLAGIAALSVLGSSSPAYADVGIEPNAVAPGREVAFTVQVMNDRASDSTTRVELAFPDKPPVPWIDVVPVPSWTVRIERRRLDHPLDTPDGTATTGVAKVVWTGGPITGGELVRFSLRVGPLTPGADRVTFDARQTYRSGRVARWNDDPTTATPRHPSPVLVVSRYAASRPPGSTDGVDNPFNLSEKDAIDSRVQSLVRRGQVATPDDIRAGRWIALVALLVAFAGLIFGVLAFLSSRRGRVAAAAQPSDDET